MNHKDIEGILNSFEIGTVSYIEKLSGGVENENYQIVSSGAKYVLRIYSADHSIKGSRSLESVETELDFVQACKGFVPVAEPVANMQGEHISKGSKGEFCVLFPHITGASPVAVSAEVVKEYAKLLSNLYDVSLHFTAAHANLEHDLVSRALAVADNSASHDRKVNELIYELKNKIQSSKPGLGALSQGMVHGDIKLSNTLFHNGNLAALLDFDDYRYSYLLEDTAMTIMHNLAQPECNILRSGLLDTFVESVTNPKLLHDIQSSLRVLIQARLLYDVCKYVQKDEATLLSILQDPQVAAFLHGN